MSHALMPLRGRERVYPVEPPLSFDVAGFGKVRVREGKISSL